MRFDLGLLALVVLPVFSWAQPGPVSLTLTLAALPPKPGVISTGSVENLQLQVLSGHEVAFARSAGRDYQLQASGGFYWTQVQEVPAGAESVAITPTLQNDGSVAVALSVARKRQTQIQSFSSTLLVPPGEWVQLFGPAPASSRATRATRATRVYGTQQNANDTLFLRVEY